MSGAFDRMVKREMDRVHDLITLQMFAVTNPLMEAVFYRAHNLRPPNDTFLPHRPRKRFRR